MVFLDPPYPLGEDDVADDLALLVEHGWLVPGALVVVERSVAQPRADLAGRLRATTARRRYGETMLWYGHAAADRRAAPSGPTSEEHHDAEPSARGPSTRSPTATSTSSAGPPRSSTRSSSRSGSTPSKSRLFTPEERIEMLERGLRRLRQRARSTGFTGLLTDFCASTASRPS